MKTSSLSCLLLPAALLLAGCPLARPREVDCGVVQAHVATAEKQLAPFEQLDPSAAPDAQVQAWADAVSAARTALPTFQDLVHDDVKDAANQYAAALDALKLAVTERKKAKSPAADAAVSSARAGLQRKRQQISDRCPAKP